MQLNSENYGDYKERSKMFLSYGDCGDCKSRKVKVKFWNLLNLEKADKNEIKFWSIWKLGKQKTI